MSENMQDVLLGTLEAARVASTDYVYGYTIMGQKAVVNQKKDGTSSIPISCSMYKSIEEEIRRLVNPQDPLCGLIIKCNAEGGLDIVKTPYVDDPANYTLLEDYTNDGIVSNDMMIDDMKLSLSFVSMEKSSNLYNAALTLPKIENIKDFKVDSVRVTGVILDQLGLFSTEWVWLPLDGTLKLSDGKIAISMFLSKKNKVLATLSKYIV